MFERIYVDFNTAMADEKGRVYIAAWEVKPTFQPEKRVIIYDETLEVRANLVFDEERGEWWAKPDWSTRHDLPYP